MQRLIKKAEQNINNINIDEEIRKYNSIYDYIEQIHYMDELEEYVIEYGYDDIDSAHDGLISDIYFNENDDYFWLDEQTGYLISGSADEVYHIVIMNNNNDNDDDDENENDDDNKNNNEKLYRYELIIDGKNYGLFNGLDYLFDKGLLKEDLSNKLARFFSKLIVPAIGKYKNTAHKSYFTQNGYEYYQFAFELLFPQLKKICKVKLITLDDNKPHIYDDKYQVII